MPFEEFNEYAEEAKKLPPYIKDTFKKQNKIPVFSIHELIQEIEKTLVY